jgi:hypothetical protein
MVFVCFLSVNATDTQKLSVNSAVQTERSVVSEATLNGVERFGKLFLYFERFINEIFELFTDLFD